MTLYELNHRVAQAVEAAVDDAVWVTAEMSEARIAAGGHCYIEFVEKHPRTGALVARAHGVIWASRLWLLQESFERATGQPLVQPGLKVMVLVRVRMHEAYGYTLDVYDIDPTYTLGEMARRRMEILRRLEAEGMLDMQHTLTLPALPQRIAVISARGAAGYGDFVAQLRANRRGVRFYAHLFPAVMQGTQTAPTVIAALERIYRSADLFDLVVIIRGGGASADLTAFDDYELAASIANFPLPVLTGIGHDRDQTVLDAVAHTSVKTPTAAAALLVQMADQQMQRLDDLGAAILESPRARIASEQQRLVRLTQAVRTAHATRMAGAASRLALLAERVRLHTRQRIDRERQRHDMMQGTIRLVQPQHILSRGFSITRLDGHAVRTPADVRPGQQVETQVLGGRFLATVTDGAVLPSVN